MKSNLQVFIQGTSVFDEPSYSDVVMARFSHESSFLPCAGGMRELVLAAATNSGGRMLDKHLLSYERSMARAPLDELHGRPC